MGPRLEGQVAVVTGASRGIGRGIALQLAEAGAVVYITGRTLHNTGDNQEGSLQKTAEEIEERGGKCIAVQCDHSDDEQVVKLFDRVAAEQNGALDILVNNAFAAAKVISDNYGVPFWDQKISAWDITNNVGLRNNYHCAMLASRLMVPRKRGLIVNISSPGGLRYLFNVPYGVGKAGVDRMTQDCAIELHDHKVTMLCIWPGAVQTENTMRLRNSDQEQEKLTPTMRKVLKDMVDTGETVEYTGLAVVHLAADKKVHKKAGKIHIVADLAAEYGFKDVNGKEPRNLRSMKTLLTVNGNTTMAGFMPECIRVPKWAIHQSGNKF